MCCVGRHTMQALPSGQMNNKPIKIFLLVIALTVLAVPVYGEAPAIDPWPAAPAPTKTQPRPETRARLLTVDSSVPDDPDVVKIIAPYEEKVRELSKVIGRIDGGLSKTGVGGGTLGNFVTDSSRAQAQAKLGKPIVLSMVNNGGLRKNEIAAGDIRASDIFAVLPFEKALLAVDVTGAQPTQMLQV